MNGRSRRFRFLLAGGLTAVTLVSAGVVGGIAYAKDKPKKPKPSAAEVEYGKPKKTFFRASLLAQAGWTLKHGKVDAKRASTDVRLKIKIKRLRPTTGSGTMIQVAFNCGTTLAGTTAPIPLSSKGDAHIDVLLSGVPVPCLNPNAAVSANGTTAAVTGL